MAATAGSMIDPDLSPFRNAGGKLILWHRWADHALTADRTVQYYHDVIRANRQQE
jgi:Tannase and feruloyl esterase